jgi:hypothetical protein
MGKKAIHHAHGTVHDGRCHVVACGVYKHGVPATSKAPDVTCLRCIRWMNVFGNVTGAPPYTGKEPGRKPSNREPTSLSEGDSRTESSPGGGRP